MKVEIVQIFKFFVPGIARSSGSKTYRGQSKRGKPILAPAGKFQKSWMDAMSWTFMRKFGRPVMIEGPVEFTAVFHTVRPDAHYRRRKGAITNEIKPNAPIYSTSTPDSDKMRRAAQDALSGLAYLDDKQVAIGHDSKPYVTDGQPPGAEITISKILTEG